MVGGHVTLNLEETFDIEAGLTSPEGTRIAA